MALPRDVACICVTFFNPRFEEKIMKPVVRVMTCEEAKAKLNELCAGWKNNRWIYIQVPRPLKQVLKEWIEDGVDLDAEPKPIRFESLGQLHRQWVNLPGAPALVARGENPRLLYVVDIVRREVKEGSKTREMVVLLTGAIQPAYYYRDMVKIVPLARLG